MTLRASTVLSLFALSSSIVHAQVLTPLRQLGLEYTEQNFFLCDMRFNIGLDSSTIAKLEGPFLMETKGLQFYNYKKRGYGTKGRENWNIEEMVYGWPAIEVNTKRKVLVSLRVPQDIQKWAPKEGKYVLVWGTTPKNGIIPLLAAQSNRRFDRGVAENFYASSKDEIVMAFGIPTNSPTTIKLPNKVDQFFANYAFAATTHSPRLAHYLMDYRHLTQKDNQVYLPEFEKLQFNPDAILAKPDSAAVAMENAVRNSSLDSRAIIYSYIASQRIPGYAAKYLEMVKRTRYSTDLFSGLIPIQFEELSPVASFEKLGLKITPLEAILLASDKKANTQSRLLFLDTIQGDALSLSEINMIGQLLRDESFLVRVQAVRIMERYYIDLLEKNPVELKNFVIPYLTIDETTNNAGDCMTFWAGFIDGLSKQKKTHLNQLLNLPKK